jgi:FAD/FMN-containing dehydrogenase
VATVGANIRIGRVSASLEKHGLALTAGNLAGGMAGLRLGGGLGMLGRKPGLTSDHLIGVQIVLADR